MDLEIVKQFARFVLKKFKKNLQFQNCKFFLKKKHVTEGVKSLPGLLKR